MTGNRPYDNPTSQAERRATLQNDQRVHKNTFFSQTHPDSRHPISRRATYVAQLFGDL